MSDVDSVELLVRVEAHCTFLCSPGVGIFSAALVAPMVVSAGQAAGILTTLGQRKRLVVPREVGGLVRSKPPARLHAAVQYGEVLYEVVPSGSADAQLYLPKTTRDESSGELALHSPQSGRFYHRSSPGEASLCEIGRELEIGTPIGLIEVMKTFTQVVYRAERGLPPQARILRVIARDASDVDEGAALIVVTPR